MPAHIDKCLLVEELLLLVTDQLLGESLDTEASIRLDQGRTNGQLSSLLHFSEVLIMFWSVLGVGDLIDVVAHQAVELSFLHGLGELGQLLLADVHLPSFEERMVDLLLLFLRLRVHADAVEVF